MFFSLRSGQLRASVQQYEKLCASWRQRSMGGGFLVVKFIDAWQWGEQILGRSKIEVVLRSIVSGLVQDVKTKSGAESLIQGLEGNPAVLCDGSLLIVTRELGSEARECVERLVVKSREIVDPFFEQIRVGGLPVFQGLNG